MKKFTCLALCMLLMSACSTSNVTTEDDTGDEMFNVVLTVAPVGFSPLKTNDSASTYVNAQIYETLYQRTLDGTSYVPLLAKSLPVCDEAGTTCTIELQEGVTFHDGTPFNADAVKYTIEKIKDPDYGSARASIAASIESVNVIDDTHLELKTSYPDGVLIAKLAHTNSAIVSPTAEAAQDLMTNPVGTGPYKFVSAISGSEVVLTRNDEYWGKTPEIKDVTMSVVTEISTAIARMETGEANFIPSVPVAQIERVKAMSNVELVTKQGSQINYLAQRVTSSKNPVMQNLDLRQAIAMAIDREGYIEQLNGYGILSRGIIGPTVFGYTEESETFGYDYDPEAAKAIIEEKGYGDEPLVLLCSNVAATLTMAEYVQANLKAVGLNNVTIEPLEWAAYLSESQVDNRFDLCLYAWSNVTGDGSELMEPNFHSINSSQRVRYNNSEFDQLVKESKETIDTEVRIEKLEAANKMIVNDAAVVPMYNAYQVFAYDKAYTNIALDPGGTFRLVDFSYAE